MSILYEKLYQSQGFNDLSIKHYLPSLVEEIVHTFPNGKSVEIREGIEDFILSAKLFQALGIIVNELITNIMKYAFVDDRQGIITIEAEQSGDRVTLSVQDNGVGMPADIDFENSSGFGLMLIKELTRQLNGTIGIERNNGTKVLLEFDRQ